ncbi:hypothetical protein F5Y13DRAFT_169838 [Hypoxylon sp. FL1857]|nr:hypothetical protein F5Y13DRAFT_169838 [Hypoxylon sp. FL1857]
MSNIFDDFQRDIHSAQESTQLLSEDLSDDDGRHIAEEFQAKLNLLSATIKDVERSYDRLRRNHEELATTRASLSKKEIDLRAEETRLQISRTDLEQQKQRLEQDRDSFNNFKLSTLASTIDNQIQSRLDNFQELLETRQRTVVATGEQTANSIGEREATITAISGALGAESDLRREHQPSSKEKEDPVTQTPHVVSRYHWNSGDYPWCHISNEIVAFLSHFRPSVEEGYTIRLEDVVLRMLPLCWDIRRMNNLELFFWEAQDSRWYCFDQLIDIGYDDDESLILDGELCEEHGHHSCLQVRLDTADDDSKSIVFRVVGGEADTPAVGLGT